MNSQGWALTSQALTLSTLPEWGFLLLSVTPGTQDLCGECQGGTKIDVHIPATEAERE